MPKLLLQRCQQETILEFRLAARQRYWDGLGLSAKGRRTAAIYLWGYAAEMLLKAAYFAVTGFAGTQGITSKDLQQATKIDAPKLGVVWAGNYHYLRGWAELLVATRAAIPGLAYTIPGFGNDVMNNTSRIYRLWREVLRYHKNVAYEFEVRCVKESVDWLMVHTNRL